LPFAPAPHHQQRKIFGGSVAGVGAQREFPRVRFQPTRGQLDVLGQQRSFDIHDGEAAGREGLAVEPHPHRHPALTRDAHPGDAGDRRKAVDQEAVRVVGDLETVHAIGRQIEIHDGPGVVVHLGDLRWFGLFG
jgi:hypothetical protein